MKGVLLRRSALVLGVVLTLTVTGCGSGATPDAETSATTPPTEEATTTTTERPTTTRAEPTTATAAGPSPDRVEVDGVSLAYECLGSGSPTVIFEHGWAPPGAETYHPSWGGARPTIEAIAEFTTACIYGRRGVSGSDPVAVDARTPSQQVADLKGLIDSVGFETPVILIGYSWGGELVRLFAGDNPEVVAGLILVDSQHPEGDAAFGQETPPPTPLEMIDFPTSHEQVGQVDDLGDLPIYLLSSGDTFPDAPEEIQETWDDLQTDIAALSSDTRTATVKGSSHFDIAGAADEITAAVRDVIDRAGT